MQGQGPSLQGQDKDQDFAYSYLLQVAAKSTFAIKQQPGLLTILFKSIVDIRYRYRS